MTFKGIDLTQIIGIVISIIGALLVKAQAKIAASSAKSAAWAQLANIGLSMVRDLWDDLSREFQARVADGVIDAADKEEFRRIVSEKVEQYTSRAELSKIASTIGLPMPGLIAWLAEFLIDRLVKAFDADTPEVADSFSVAEEPSPDYASGG
jgi:hypothetical protein